MGFSAKQVQALRRNMIIAISARVRPMAANSLISRVGTPSRRPTGSSDSMAGTGRRSNPNASLPAKIGALSWRSTSPGCGSPYMRTARPSFGKAMAPAKAMAHPRARCTTSPSRLRKPMPPSGRWLPSVDRLVLSSIGVAGQRIPEAPARSQATVTGPAVPAARRRPPRLPSGRHDPHPAALPLLWSSSGYGRAGFRGARAADVNWRFRPISWHYR